VRQIAARELARQSLVDRVDQPGHHVVDFDADATFSRSVAIGVVLGIPVGVLVTLGLVALAAAVSGSPLGEGAIGGIGAGALLGVLFGGVAGVAANNRQAEAVELIDEIPVSGENVVVAVQANGHGAEVREHLEAAGGHAVAPHAELTS